MEGVDSQYREHLPEIITMGEQSHFTSHVVQSPDEEVVPTEPSFKGTKGMFSLPERRKKAGCPLQLALPLRGNGKCSHLNM